MEMSIKDIIAQWHAENCQSFSSPLGKGSTYRIPFKDAEDILVALFNAIIQIGYKEEDIFGSNKSNYEAILKCFIPHSMAKKKREGWEFNVSIDIRKARAIVFGSLSSKKAIPEIATDETAVRYGKMHELTKEPKKYKKLKKNKSIEDTIEEDEDEFVELDGFKLLDRGKLPEVVPEIDSDDDSWIHDMAESYDE